MQYWAVVTSDKRTRIISMLMRFQTCWPGWGTAGHLVRYEKSGFARYPGPFTACRFCEHLNSWGRGVTFVEIVCCILTMFQTGGQISCPLAVQGMAIVRLLKQIELRTQRRIYELFDLICGTSTGGILAVAIALKQLTLEQCEDIYRWVPGLNAAT